MFPNSKASWYFHQTINRQQLLLEAFSRGRISCFLPMRTGAYQDRINTVNLQAHLVLLHTLVKQLLRFYLLGEKSTIKPDGAWEQAVLFTSSYCNIWTLLWYGLYLSARVLSSRCVSQPGTQWCSPAIARTVAQCWPLSNLTCSGSCLSCFLLAARREPTRQD